MSQFSAPGEMMEPEKPTRAPRRGIPKADTSNQRKSCNCRNSRCLKLYCECFASGQYCFACNCQGCHNNPENDEKRKRAIESTLERNPQAFRPKVSHAVDSSQRHNKGCHCKKSGCLKKYCECFQASINCTDQCKCTDCKNREGFVGAPRPGASPASGAKRARTDDASPSGGSSHPATPAQMGHAAAVSTPVNAGPDMAPVGSSLAKSRMAVSATTSETLVAGLVREMLAAPCISEGGARYEEQEQHILNCVHAALHTVLSAARAAPQMQQQHFAQQPEPDSAAASSSAAPPPPAAAPPAAAPPAAAQPPAAPQAAAQPASGAIDFAQLAATPPELPSSSNGVVASGAGGSAPGAHVAPPLPGAAAAASPAGAPVMDQHALSLATLGKPPSMPLAPGGLGVPVVPVAQPRPPGPFQPVLQKPPE